MSDAPAALVARDIVRSFGTGRVVDGFSLTAPPGRRIGLIGENGVGKSTLLRLLAGADEPDAGSIVRPADLGFLHQEMPFAAAATLTDVLDEALSEVRGALAEIERLSARLAGAEEDSPGYAALLDTYGRLLERAQEQEAWDADRRATMVLEGLGVGGIRRDRTLGSLSGGQRGRLALASLLIRRPSALLLDEPTNHLDDNASAFLEEQVCGLPGAVVVASHDRAFLDAVCTDLIDLDPSVDGPVRYGGNYSAYQAEKRAERERWERRYAEEQEELDVLRRSIGTTTHRLAPDRGPRDNEKMGYGVRANRVQSQISRRARNAARRLDELERHRVAEPPQPLRFRRNALAGPPAEGDPSVDGDPSAEGGPWAEGGPSAEGVLVSLRDVRVPGRLTLDRLDVSATERLLVTGENGAGKSTLLAVLAGRLTADGDVRHKGGLSVGLLAQDTVFRRPDRTVRDLYAQALGPERAEAVPLSSLGLMGEADLGKQVGRLSVGQRRRLALALLVAHPPELLLLDEPTNHLSPRLCDELEAAMGPGPGAIVLTGHDRWLRRRWQGRELRL
ncbi:ABC-F family ATP-binding cassette domain-containing protein [Streptomyces sp. NPDC058378]|uniref:ABC-F family ATP-binding cassette domain-containing protein n=1 Tax=Streptomyces sp. NPDC058378 TaxID=3346469 RepID=UPI00364DD87D